MKRTLILVAVLFTLSSIPAIAVVDGSGALSTAPETVNRNDLERVTNCMMWRTCQGTLLARDYYGGDFDRQIVFVEQGQRYTLLLNWGDNTLSIWVRPEGTTDQASVSTFTDMGVDGDIDFGVTGSVRLTDDQRKHFYNTESPPGCDSLGLEFQKHWNECYTAAIAAAVRHLCPNPPRKKRGDLKRTSGEISRY